MTGDVFGDLDLTGNLNQPGASFACDVKEARILPWILLTFYLVEMQKKILHGLWTTLQRYSE